IVFFLLRRVTGPDLPILLRHGVPGIFRLILHVCLLAADGDNSENGQHQRPEPQEEGQRPGPNSFPALHGVTSSRYLALDTFLICLPAGPRASRRLRTPTPTARSPPSKSRPQTLASSLARERTRPWLRIRHSSRS